MRADRDQLAFGFEMDCKQCPTRCELVEQIEALREELAKQQEFRPYSDRDTSRAAAKKTNVTKGEREVLAVIANHPDGLTDDEVEVITGLPHQSVSARRRGLARAGRVYKTNQKRKTRTGNWARVWRVVEGVEA